MRQDVQICNFSRGELTPKLKSRTDYEGYFHGLATELNAVTLPQGGATRRPGTMLAALTKDQTDNPFQVTEMPFLFSTTQPYDLEIGQGYIRPFKSGGQILNVEAVTGAANNGGGLVRLAIAATAGLYTGNSMTVSGIAGTTEANGTWSITVIDGTHVDLQGSAFVHAYVSGGSSQTIVEIPTYLAIPAGSTVASVATALPWQVADLPALEYTQSADTLYICHPNYPTIVVTRSSHTNWTAKQLAFFDGPYLAQNGTATTLTPSGTTGSITITASSIVGINATGQSTGQGFLATDIGRALRIKDSGTWGWAIISAIGSTTSVTAVVQAAVNNGAAGALDGTSATLQWQMGKWSQTTGYPQVPMFWQQRLVSAGTNNQPNAVEASVTGDFTNMAPTQSDSSVQDNNALSWVISDDQVNALRWLSPAGSAAAMQLGIGTTGGEDILQPATTSQALSPTNVQVYRETSLGSAPNVRPVRIGKAVLFANRPGRKLQEWQWAWAVNGYLGPDRTVDAEHITRPTPSTLQGIMWMAYQQNPNGIIWCGLGDGSLVAMTYLPEQQVGAWHRHRLGGQYYGGPPFVERGICIPSDDGSYDELWLTVLRTVNGVVTRTKEVMARFFDALPAEQAVFVDCALSSTLGFPAATLTPPTLPNVSTLQDAPPMFAGTGTYAASAAVFAGTSADVGMFLRLNNGIAVVTGAVDTQHVVAQSLAPMTSLKPAGANAWSGTAQHGSFSGLGILNGETVQILGDGADFGTAVVASGSVALSGTASYATIGLPYPTVLITMPWEPQKAVAEAQGHAKSIDHLFLRFHESLGCSYGRRRTDPLTGVVDEAFDVLQTRSAADLMGQAPALETRMERLPLEGGWDYEGQIAIATSGPFPLTVLGIGAMAEVGEMEPA